MYEALSKVSKDNGTAAKLFMSQILPFAGSTVFKLYLVITKSEDAVYGRGTKRPLDQQLAAALGQVTATSF